MKKRATPKKTLDKAAARLTALLRSPKPKAGLVAAVKDLGLTHHFVSGWISREVKADRVMPVHYKAAEDKHYVLCDAPAPDDTQPPPSAYPSWMEPRSVPRYAQRRLCANLDPSNTQQEQEESESCHGKEGARKADC
jgi:hypothetical protein